MQPAGPEAIREAVARDVLAADLRCSLFVSALQSYKRDSVLRPFPAAYAQRDRKDFEALLAVAGRLPNLKELLQWPEGQDRCAWDLVSWILSSKAVTVCSAAKAEFDKIRKLTGTAHAAAPTPDFLFEVQHSGPADAQFQEARGGRGLLYAFHGSRLDNFHSILHNGLHWHLSKTALFGEGTYLTSDLSLALLYSPNGHGWQRSLLGPILSCVAVCEVIDHPDVKCQTKKKAELAASCPGCPATGSPSCCPSTCCFWSPLASSTPQLSSTFGTGRRDDATGSPQGHLHHHVPSWDLPCPPVSRGRDQGTVCLCHKCMSCL
ncbi:protein mono-ADP-ribosyltransferase PARP16 isoform X2 [Erinaceus europaeus]|uniref:Poly [ADP-ribose] polymerase n=1 Tax=Erinaceus europaeus TaxID=9365 RepID=A0A1S3WN56_ERIEU|nr:protein mono-ADP-ribosyltransferase PARP16 isoform X2 [Erinaceus europaeus]